MPSNQKVYYPAPRIRPERGIAGVKDFSGNMVLVDPVTGKEVKDGHIVTAKTSAENRSYKPTEPAKTKRVITNKATNDEDEAKPKAQPKAKAKSGGDVADLG